jgi:hypothetical protein
MLMEPVMIYLTPKKLNRADHDTLADQSRESCAMFQVLFGNGPARSHRALGGKASDERTWAMIMTCLREIRVSWPWLKFMSFDRAIETKGHEKHIKWQACIKDFSPGQLCEGSSL